MGRCYRIQCGCLFALAGSSELQFRALRRAAPLALVARTARPVTQVAKPARTGDFLPQAEVVSVVCKQRLKQCRRARTLLRGLNKFLAQSTPSENQLQQLLGEWVAICRAPGYRGGFVPWVLFWTFIVSFPVDFPSQAWLSDLVRLLEFDCEAMAAQEAALRRKSFRQAVLQDEACEFSRMGYRSLRPAPKPPFTAVSSTVRQPAQLCQHITPGEWLCTVDSPHLFRPGLEVHFESHWSCGGGAAEVCTCGLR